MTRCDLYAYAHMTPMSFRTRGCGETMKHVSGDVEFATGQPDVSQALALANAGGHGAGARWCVYEIGRPRNHAWRERSRANANRLSLGIREGLG